MLALVTATRSAVLPPSSPVHTEASGSLCRICHRDPDPHADAETLQVYDPAGGALCSTCLDRVYLAVGALLGHRSTAADYALLQAFVAPADPADPRSAAANTPLVLGLPWSRMILGNRVQELSARALKLWLVLALHADVAGATCAQAAAFQMMLAAKPVLMRAREDLVRAGLLKVLKASVYGPTRFRLLRPREEVL